jgi:hypothetical protein
VQVLTSGPQVWIALQLSTVQVSWVQVSPVHWLDAQVSAVQTAVPHSWPPQVSPALHASSPQKVSSVQLRIVSDGQTSVSLVQTVLPVHVLRPPQACPVGQSTTASPPPSAMLSPNTQCARVSTKATLRRLATRLSLGTCVWIATRVRSTSALSRSDRMLFGNSTLASGGCLAM